ncbi:MAG: DEAD/DEAH box helicase, partial [Candidatus Lokiarchaeota archaeon]
MMVDFKEFLRYIKKQNYYSDQIKYIEQMPAEPAKYGDLTGSLDIRLQKWLKRNKVKLWSHQAKAINLIRKGMNTVIATSTASGKSLCYNLSVFDSLLNDEKTTALYIFPTKALSRDQYHILLKMMLDMNIHEERVGVYDGDIESYEKRQVLEKSNIIITNPYGLHFYLPWFTRKWSRICKNLKYVILDEVHVYRGIFGSNFALLLRRLKRILENYGVKPIWILSSATINNPKKLAENLVGEEFNVVSDDGSPAGAKNVILWELPYDEFSGKYRSPHQETKNLFVSHLELGIQTLTFTLSRKMAELQAMWTRRAIPHLRNKIFSYRAGISKKSRREIE